jgi:hypothetical protein
VSDLHRSFANLVQCTKRLDEIAELARAYGSADITEKITQAAVKMIKKAFSSRSPSAKVHDGGAAAPAGQVAPTTTKNPTTARSGIRSRNPNGQGRRR